MDKLIQYWSVILAGGCVAGAIVMAGLWFKSLPGEKQIAKIKEWLLWAVTEAEKDLGAGTGALKLRKVYDMFLAKFPQFALVISFEQFGKYVQEALDKMQDLLAQNKKVEAYVKGDEE